MTQRADGFSTLFGDRHRVVHARRGDAQVVVQGEPLAVQHLGPGEAERVHDGRAAVFDALAQGPARLDGLVQVVQAHRSEQGAQELPGVRVTLLLNQRDPGRRLLQDLVHGFVAEQVGQAHLRVLDVVAQEEVCRDGLAVVLLIEQFVLAEVVQSVDRLHAGEDQQPHGCHGGTEGSHVGGNAVDVNSDVVEHQSAWMQPPAVSCSYWNTRFSSRRVWEESPSCVKTSSPFSSLCLDQVWVYFVPVVVPLSMSHWSGLSFFFFFLSPPFSSFSILFPSLLANQQNYNLSDLLFLL